jgi:hypothetical protein
MKTIPELNVQDFYDTIQKLDNENDIKINLNNVRKQVLFKMLEVCGFLYGLAQYRISATNPDPNDREPPDNNMLHKGLMQDLLNDLTEYQSIHLAIDEAVAAYPSVILGAMPMGSN